MPNIAFVYPTTKKEEKFKEKIKLEQGILTVKTEKLHDGWKITKPIIEKNSKGNYKETH